MYLATSIGKIMNTVKQCDEISVFLRFVVFFLQLRTPKLLENDSAPLS
jgi:hypothetical protein